METQNSLQQAAGTYFDTVESAIERLASWQEKSAGDLPLAAPVARFQASLTRQPGPGRQLLGRRAQSVGDRLHDVARRAPQPALDLRQVGIGDAGQVGELAQRQLVQLALAADHLAERRHVSGTSINKIAP